MRSALSDRRYCGGLDEKIELHVGYVAMIVINVDTMDGLVNGATGIVRHVSTHEGRNDAIWIEFDNPRSGALLRNRSPLIKMHATEVSGS